MTEEDTTALVIALPAREIVALCDWGVVYATGESSSVTEEPRERLHHVAQAVEISGCR